MKNEQLTTDEYDALELVRRGVKRDNPGACVGRNLKRLSGIKMMETTRDGRIVLTEKGQQVLFLRRCIKSLTALADDAQAPLDADVLRFLSLKSHIAPLEGGGYALTDKGRESLDDITRQQEQQRR
jgi:DNA-binding PadR family transcriptional regulator